MNEQQERKFIVEATTRYVVKLRPNFRMTYTGNDGQEHPRGRDVDIAIQLAARFADRGEVRLSEMDGYADLPDGAAEVYLEDEDWEVF